MNEKNEKKSTENHKLKTYNIFNVSSVESSIINLYIIYKSSEFLTY